MSDTALNVVAVSGSLNDPSKTTVLVREISRRLGEHLPITEHLIRVNELGPSLAGALTRDEVSAEVEAELRRIETADVLIVGSPVYRASFTGLFKHLFDFVDQYALADTPVFLAATGGSERHALIIEHQFRPLFSFFQALTLPLGVYAHNSDFTHYELTSQLLAARIEKAITHGLPLIRSSAVEKRRVLGGVGVDGVATDTATINIPQPVDPTTPVRLYS
ncbi:FMN reductase [Klugiella xanthotipulae]|uniref:FMN reductase n=1 Tax=Klugiella xanthotipulae TaxID=244735 RepID=A0A543HZ54_9MICO|nr:FMN reductase [Klugiella xanthotipulae]TQM63611.1 FMN reductase [Klugiella xanthotipulae]